MTKEQVYASRFFGTSLELRLFLGGIILGMFLGAVYDLFRALRLSFRHPKPLVFFEDILFMLVSGISYYSFCTELCRGQIRFFVLLASLIGFAAYLSTVGRLVSRAFAKSVMIAKNALLRVGKVLKKILGVLCGVPFFQKTDPKFEENPCADGDT